MGILKPEYQLGEQVIHRTLVYVVSGIFVNNKGEFTYFLSRNLSDNRTCKVFPGEKLYPYSELAHAEIEQAKLR